MSRTTRLEAMIRRLLNCPALNLDDLENEDRAAIRASLKLVPERRPVFHRRRNARRSKGGRS